MNLPIRKEKAMDRKPTEKKAPEKTDAQELIIGRNAVREALKAGRPVNTLLVKKGERTGALLPIIAECRDRGIPVKEVDAKKLDYMCGHQNHQGVLMLAAAGEYSTVEEILAEAEARGEAPFIVICDGIEDPHNLGAIIRSAEAGGAHGLIIPERRRAGIPEGGAGEEPEQHRKRPAGTRRLGLRRGYGRKTLSAGGPFRPHRAGDRRRGRGRIPPYQRALRRQPLDTDEGKNKLPERLGGGRDPDIQNRRKQITSAEREHL